MTESFYGQGQQTTVSDEISRCVEEVKLHGFALLPEVIPAAALDGWRTKVDTLYAEQEAKFGREALAKIAELDLCRAPLLYDLSFLELANHPRVMPIIRAMLGDWVILNLQNAIINRPNTPHHQASWHRDLPHQNWVISKPIAMNAMVTLDPFSAETGATMFLPVSHRSETLPSDDYIARHGITVSAPAGSVILFDAMLFHRAGTNSSGMIRRAINQLYTVPILKQQYDFARALGERTDLDFATQRLLGYDSQVPLHDVAWREARLKRLQKTEHAA